ncbi:MAG: 3'-5' exonuclease, partial [Nanoarchaeota archaeon]
MAELNFYPIDITYKVEKGIDTATAAEETQQTQPLQQPVVELYGKGIEGVDGNKSLERVNVRYFGFLPYFWVIPLNDAEEASQQLQLIKADNPEFKIITTEKHTKNYLGKEVKAVKVIANIPAAVPWLREKAKTYGTVLEADIPFTRRFLIDKRVLPLALYKAEATETEEPGRKIKCYKTQLLNQVSEEQPQDLRILAIDIETHNPLG